MAPHFATVFDLTAADPGATALILRGHEGGVRSVGFSGDGRWAITSGERDQTVRLWDLDINSLIANAKRLAGRGLTETEKQTFSLMSR